MSADANAPRSRRTILASAVGAALATVASAIGRPAAVRAGVDGDVVLGAANVATATTSISNTTNDETVFAGQTDSGVAIQGVSGAALNEVPGPITTSTAVYGISLDGTGVYGASDSGAGVWAATHSTTHGSVTSQNDEGTAVHGHSGGTPPETSELAGIYGSAEQLGGDASARIGVLGTSDGTGVIGVSGSTIPTAVPGTGVFGYAAIDSASRGVVGQSAAGQGVRGIATTGIGVRGYADAGVAGSFETTSGMALVTKGRVRFQQVAGKASLASGSSQVTVTPGVDLTSGTSVLASLNGHPGGSTVIQRVSIDTAANTFTVHLTAASTATINVAWFVLDQ